MPILNVTIRNKIAIGDGSIVVCDNSDYIVHFDFDEEWNAYEAKTMVIRYGLEYQEAIFTGNEAPLPVLHERTIIMIGCYAGNLHTTTPACFDCLYSVTSNLGTHIDPPEDVYHQLMDLYHRSIPPYASLERLRSYLFRITFDKLSEENDISFPVASGCSSYVKNGKLYRNLDFKYDEAVSFNVQCRGFKGMAFLSNITEGNLDHNYISQLPYNVVDGSNESGIMVAEHVLFNDWNWHGSGEISLQRVPYLILSQIKTLDNFPQQIANLVGNLKTTELLDASGYLLQFLVTDGTTTYVIVPPESEAGSYEVIDATLNPKLSNFRWVADATVSRTDLQTHPTGVERWNSMPNASLSDLRFTKAYEEPTRLSEFIGIDGTDKDSTDAELIAVYNKAAAIYANRQRDGKLWQTMHSIVYSQNGIESLFVQEDFARDYSHKT